MDNMIFKPFFTFIIRTPNRSFDFLQQKLEKKLLDIHVQEAIYLASPVLYQELKKLLHGEIKSTKEQERIRYSLNRYLSRMATRCTPFGLFAGCAIGNIGNTTTRLDMYFLCTLSQILSRIPEIKQKIKYYPNTSLYPIGQTYRYIEYKYVRNQRRHFISSIKKSKYLSHILKMAENGVSIRELTDYLVKENFDIEIVIQFINELIDYQVIESELTPSVTGEDYFEKIIRILESINLNNELFSFVQEIKQYINQLDTVFEATISIYQKIIDIIKKFNIDYEERFLFQVDMIRAVSQATLGKEVMDELYDAIHFLNKITPNGANATFNKFKEDFQKRYEDKEMPLAEVLDPELGIGYPSLQQTGDVSPLVDDFAIPVAMGNPTFQTTYFQSVIHKKLLECLRQNRQEIIFTDEDVKDLPANWNDLPPTIYAMFQIISTSSSNLSLRLKSCGGSCAANLLGRFAHADKDILQLVNEITQREQELIPNAIIAEIAHLPENRVGNILARPHIRDYEIVYMAHSDLSKKQILYITDLYLSIRQGRLYLRSKKLNKEIIPRLITAHNFQNNTMPVYRFLCDLQTQGLRNGLFFNWGYLANELEFIPRVKYKNTILSPAIWKVKIDDIKQLFSINEENLLIAQINQWRAKVNLPQYVLLMDGDNELFVNWKDKNSIQTLFSIIKNRAMIQFSEFLFDPETAEVEIKTNSTANQQFADNSKIEIEIEVTIVEKDTIKL
jgi:hypothetical protein